MKTMICEHCEENVIGMAYHVISEEDGVVLLNMMVCGPCAVEAKSLGLTTQELTRAFGHAPLQSRRCSRARCSL